MELCESRKTGFNSKYKEKWEFTAKEHGKESGVGGWKISKRKHHV